MSPIDNGKSETYRIRHGDLSLDIPSERCFLRLSGFFSLIHRQGSVVTSSVSRGRMSKILRSSPEAFGSREFYLKAMSDGFFSGVLDFQLAVVGNRSLPDSDLINIVTDRFGFLRRIPPSELRFFCLMHVIYVPAERIEAARFLRVFVLPFAKQILDWRFSVEEFDGEAVQRYFRAINRCDIYDSNLSNDEQNDLRLIKAEGKARISLAS